MARLVPLTSKGYDYRPDIQLHIVPGRESGRYLLEVVHEHLHHVQLDINKTDVALLTKTLQERLKDVAEKAVSRLNLSEDDLSGPLDSLAKAGHWAFTRLLGGGVLVKQLIDLERGRVGTRALIIQITSPDFSFPWELLYPHSLEKPSFEHFLGFQFIVSRISCRLKEDAALLNNEIECSPRLRLGLVLDTSLTHVKTQEFPYFTRLRDRKQVALSKLEALYPSSRRRGIHKFKSFVGRPLHVAHFACHGSVMGETKGLQEIKIDDDFHITVEEMEAEEISFTGYPLVVMNNCESGNINPQYSFHFANYFLNTGGARGLIATECKVPDEFAAAFSQRLYNDLLSGKPLGESILRARQYFLSRLSNPLGLAYCLYAPPSIRFAIPKEVLVG
jgi:CHAT domain-containing protein